MHLNRRFFVAWGLGLFGLGLAGAGTLAGVTSNQRLVIGIVKRYLTYGGISDAELLDFARAFLAEPKRPSNAKLTILRMLAPVMNSNELARKAMPNIVARGYESFEREVFTQFVLSTDLFDESRQDVTRISYIGYYDPLSSSCSNPLTKL